MKIYVYCLKGDPKRFQLAQDIIEWKNGLCIRNRSDKINIIDPVKLELVKQIDVGNGPHGIRTSFNGKLLYVDVTSTNKV